MKYVYEFMSLSFALSEMCFALTVRHGVFGNVCNRLYRLNFT